MKKRIILFVIFSFISIFVPKVYAAENEVKVGDEFSSLVGAIDKLKDTGGTIELQEDVTLSEEPLVVSVSKPITINLNNHSIDTSTQDLTIVFAKGEVILTGTGSIKNTKTRNRGGVVYVKGSNTEGDKNYTHLIIDKNVTIEGPNPLVIDLYDQDNPHCYGAVVDIYGKILNNVQGSVSPTGISVNSKLKDTTNAPTINVYDGASIKNTNDGGVGIYLFGYANINIYKATVESHTGIFASSGSINLEGATITGTGEKDYKEMYGRGTGATGAAIQIESNSSYIGEVELNIDGGNYTSEHNSAIIEYTNNKEETSIKEINIYDGDFTSSEGKDTISISEEFEENTEHKEFISGGKFLSGEEGSDVSKYVKSEYIEDENGNVIKKPGTNDDETSGSKKPSNVSNPNTYDNVYTYIFMLIFSLIGVGVSLKKYFS